MPNDSFTYASEPHSALQRKAAKHYRPVEEMVEGVPLTLMSDPRVIRGNTHSLAKKVAKSGIDLNTTTLKLTKRADTISVSRPSYVYEVKSFSNNEIDVSKYLIQQDDFPTRSKNSENQTDDFKERPRTPEYIPRKTGMDRSTQVEDVTELFDFDTEVVPIVNVIVTKIIEQSKFELESEYELSTLEHTAAEYRTVSDQEAEWIRQKELTAIKDAIATKVRIQSLEVHKQNQTALKTQVAGLQMMRQIFPSVIDTVFEANFASGAWVTAEKTQVRDIVLPELIGSVVMNVQAHGAARETLDDLLFEAQALYTTHSPNKGTSTEDCCVLNVTFRSAAENQQTEGDSQQTISNEATLSFRVHPSDSVQSLEAIIRGELSRLKAVPAAPEEGTESSPDIAENALLAAKLPPINYPLNLHQRLSALLLQIHGPPAREIARDGLLCNFPWPKDINIDILF